MLGLPEAGSDPLVKFMVILKMILNHLVQSCMKAASNESELPDFMPKFRRDGSPFSHWHILYFSRGTAAIRNLTR